MAAVTSAVILGPEKRKSVIVSTFSPCICHEVMGLEGFPGGLAVKNSPAETQVQSLSREETLEQEMATYSSMLA